MDKPTLKICPSCGKTFGCQGDTDCWCEKVKLHRRQMVEIMEKYSDCLCSDCLKKYEME